MVSFANDNKILKFGVTKKWKILKMKNEKLIRWYEKWKSYNALVYNEQQHRIFLKKTDNCCQINDGVLVEVLWSSVRPFRLKSKEFFDICMSRINIY